MVKSGESISERALRGMRREPESGGGESQSSSVQGSLSERASPDYAVKGEGGLFGRVIRRIRGRFEFNSGVPVAPPVGLSKKPSLMDIVMAQRAELRKEMAIYAHEHGLESFEDANDFDVGDDPVGPDTPWEFLADNDLTGITSLDDAHFERLKAAAVAEGKRRDALNPRMSSVEAGKKPKEAPVASPAPGPQVEV